MLFLQCMGFGGKMAINSFVLLSGYFVCKQKVTWLKLLKLFTMIYFYNILFYIVFLFTGHEEITLKSIYKVVFNPFYGIERGFTGSFLAFYCLVPFLNRFLQSLNQKLHLRLILLLLFIYTFVATFLLNTVAFSHIWWYVTLYFIAAYIRLYPNKYTDNKKLALWVFICSVLLIFASIVVVDFIGSRIGFTNYYHMCNDSQKFLALTGGLSLFLYFKNVQIKHSKFINTIASTTFGVLLIHANSNAMRTFLWQDTLQNTAFYDSAWLPLHMLISVVGVYVICVAIDYLRIKFLEKPIFSKLSTKYSILYKECFVE